MTKFFKYFIFAFLLMPLTSCDDAKDIIEEEEPLNPFEVLKSNQWAIEDVKMVHVGNVIDLTVEDNGTFPFCAQDNYYSFNDGGIIETLENSNICLDAPTIKAYIDGNWISTNQKDSLIIINTEMVTMVGAMNAPSETKIELDLVYDLDWLGNPYNLKLSLFSIEED